MCVNFISTLFIQKSNFAQKSSKIHQFFIYSGSGKRFQASVMRAIDSPHKISPNRVIVEKQFSKKHEKIAQIPIFLNTPCILSIRVECFQLISTQTKYSMLAIFKK